MRRIERYATAYLLYELSRRISEWGAFLDTESRCLELRTEAFEITAKRHKALQDLAALLDETTNVNEGMAAFPTPFKEGADDD